MIVKNMSNMKLSKNSNGKLIIGRKLCSMYKKQELINLAKRLSVDHKGDKKTICNKLKAVLNI